MKIVSPQVFLVAETGSAPQLRIAGAPNMADYLQVVQAPEWTTNASSEGEFLTEFGGRLCYRAWKPGLNVNVVKIREGIVSYLENILKSGHGSVLEHASVSFVFHNVSRVFTHELVRHRAGTAISQESMRFVRLTDIPFWFPAWAAQDAELLSRSIALLHALEEHQTWMAERFKLDEPGIPFSEKKHKTSFMRRFAPDGVATGILWTANFRALRHVIKMRTEASAEEEIRLVFDLVASICKEAFPAVFQDFVREYDGTWRPQYPKV